VRRGGNCPNSLEVLAQLVSAGPPPPQHKQQQQQQQQKLPLKLHMISCLPGAGTAATRKILASFGGNGDGNAIDFSRCLYREGYEEPASSYIIRSGATGSRTIVNFSELPEMTVGEFEAIVDAFTTEHDGDECWWHFEVGRCGEKRKIKSLSRWTLPPSLSLIVLPRSTKGVSCVVCCVVALLLTPKTRADFQRQRSVASAICALLRRGARLVLRLRSLAGKAWSNLPPRPTSSFTREAGLR
jgi:ketohexokinase